MIANFRVKKAVVKADQLGHTYVVTGLGGKRVMVTREAFEALFEPIDPIVTEPHAHGDSTGHPKE